MGKNLGRTMKQIKVLLDNFIAEKHKAEQLEVTENGTYTAPQGVAYDEVTVDVQPPLEEQEIEITEPSTVEVEATGDNYGLSKVTVNATYEKEHHDVKILQVLKNGEYQATGDTVYDTVRVSVPTPLLTTLNVTENGNYKAINHTAYNEVNVDVQPNLIATRVEYNENGTFELDPPAGFDGIASAEIRVQVDIPPIETEDIEITENGTYLPSVDKDGFGQVEVNVQHEFEAEPLTINSLNDLPATSNKGWLSAIKGNDLFHEEPVEITENGERYGYNVVTGQVIRKFNVNVQPALYNFEQDIIENGSYIIDPPAGYDGLASVQVMVDVPATGGFDTSIIKGTAYMFADYSGSTLDLTGLDTSNATRMQYMFSGCTRLTTLDLSGLNTANNTNTVSMFDGCSNLTSLNLTGLDTSKVTSMKYMFRECSKLPSLDLSSFNTSNVTDMSYMFHTLYQMKTVDLSNFDTSNVTTMAYMFCNSKFTTLDLSTFKTGKVTTFSYMFKGNDLLQSLNCSGWTTTNVGTVDYIFSGCKYLTDLDISGWDLTKASGTTAFSNAFNGCSKLTNVTADNLILPKNRSLNFLSGATALTADSIVAFLNGLQPITASYTFTIGATNLAKLTDVQKAIATSKGWKLA